MVSNAVSAKYSRPSEVVISMKSGTNGLHGSAFETNRNNAVGLARSRTDNYTKPPYLNRNEFGVNAGGPLIIPKVYNGKDKTFWWFGYEGRQSISYSTISFNVPTQAMANGDFSGYKDSQGRVPDDLRSPFHRARVTGLQDARRLSETSSLPTARRTSRNICSVSFHGRPLAPTRWWTSTGSVRPGAVPRCGTRTAGWIIASPRRTRYTPRCSGPMSSTLYPTTAGGVGQPMLNGVAGLEFDSNQSMSLAPTWLHTFSPTFFNEFIIAGKRNVWFGGEVEGGNWPDRFGLPNPFE